MRRGAAWAVANWLLDAASLWFVLHAFGHSLSPVDTLVAFCVAQVLGAIPVTPGGLGLIEAALPALLAGLSGVPIESAVVAVLGWRILQFWMPIALGAASYASLKSVRRRRGAPGRRAGDEARTPPVQAVIEWDLEDIWRRGSRRSRPPRNLGRSTSMSAPRHPTHAGRETCSPTGPELDANE